VPFTISPPRLLQIADEDAVTDAPPKENLPIPLTVIFRNRITSGVASALVGVLALGSVEARVQRLAAASPLPSQSDGPTLALGLLKPAPVVPLEEGFRNPPAISRVQCWWQLPGSAFTREEITRELEEFKASGMGGVTIKDSIFWHRSRLSRAPGVSLCGR
jgi:hypothetical protein